MPSDRGRVFALAVTLAALLSPALASAHPMGNFSISHYAGIRIERDAIHLRYVLDLAEIPTFQEIQETGIVPEAGHPSGRDYLARAVPAWTRGLTLEVDGRRLVFRPETAEAIFPPGAGGLPTLKVGIVYRASLDGFAPGGAHDLVYRDENFPDRAGWKEIVARAAPGVALLQSTAPESDRSRELADYPTDLAESPPQDLTARVRFVREGATSVAVAPAPARPERPTSPPRAARQLSPPAPPAEPVASAPVEPPALAANRQPTPRSGFTELIAARELGLGLVLAALAVAAGLGAFHALEPGHGKTVVAAYLVGSRGTAWHALVLGLVVTLSHTAGVYLLGAVTLYASRHVVPERLYPWLGVASGLAIAILGASLFLGRWRRRETPAGDPDDDHAHGDHHDHGGRHDHGHPHHHHAPVGPVSLRVLVALGVTGGIVPCPAALVVLLSAVALRRIGFGLLLIVAFSVGLAAVLIGIGLLMVYARRFMSRFQGEGPLVTRWLPLASAAVIALSGVAALLQGLASAGVVDLGPLGRLTL